MVQENREIKLEDFYEFDTDTNFIDAVLDVLLVIERNELLDQLNSGTTSALLLMARERLLKAKDFVSKLKARVVIQGNS